MMALHVEGCPLRRPYLYNLDECPLECCCDDITADNDDCPQQPPCSLCNHLACGWCSECHPDMPEWTI